MLAFVRIVSNPVIVRAPLTPAAAWRYAVQWLALPNVWIPLPGEQHAKVLGELLGNVRTTSRMVPDAHLAALALEHGLTLCSTDGDFAKFPRLRWDNPLAA
jgi:toxin-antitoxin system PIN domain toxin